MEKFGHGSFTGQIVRTSHGPEIVLSSHGSEIERLTVGEFEKLVLDAKSVAVSARSVLSARARLGIPMDLR